MMRPTAPVAPTIAIVSNTAKNLPGRRATKVMLEPGRAAYSFILARSSKPRSIGDPPKPDNVRASRWICWRAGKLAVASRGTEGVGGLLPLEALHRLPTTQWQKAPDPVARPKQLDWHRV